jgi:hypothetical protein
MASDNRIETIISANAAQFRAGVGQAAESARGAADQIKSSFEHVAEIFGVALSVEGIKSFVERMADLGEKTQRTGAMLGMSNAQVLQLGGLAQLTGTSAEGLTMALGRMYTQIQRSTRDAFSPAAQGLRAMGMSAKEFIDTGGDAGKILMLLHEHLSQLNPSMNRFAAMTSAGGYRIAQLIPTLAMSNDKFNEFIKQLSDAQKGEAALIPGLADTNERLVLLSQATQNFGAQLFSALKPAIDAVTDGVRHWLQTMSEADIKGTVTSIALAIINMGEGIALFFVSVGGTIEAIKPNLGLFLGAMAAIAVATRQWQVAAVLGAVALKETMTELGISFGKPSKELEAMSTKITAMATNLRAAFTTGPGKVQGEVGGGADVKAINAQAQQQVAAQREAINEEIKLKDEAYQRDVERMTSMVKTSQMTEQQKTANLITAVNQREDAELALLTKEASIHGLSLAQLQEIENKKTQVMAKAMADRMKLVDQQYQSEIADANKAAGQISGAINGQMRSILSGQESFAVGMKKIFADLVMNVIEGIIKMALEWIMQTQMMMAATAALKALEVSMGMPLMPLAVGSYDVPHDMPAYIHKGEMVVPAGLASAMRAGMGAPGAGATSSFASSMTDSRQVHVNFNNQGGGLSAADVSAHARTIAKAVVSHWTLNPSTRPRGF